MKTKTEIDGQHPSSSYLVVGDPDETATWHLRVRDKGGNLDHKLMGDAWAALHEGFRGRKYQGPDREEAIRKLVALYHAEGMTTPDGQAPPQPVSNRGSHSHIVMNRVFESDGGYIHIVPKGELPNSEAGLIQVLDDKSLDSILANIERAKNREGDNWPGIYAGREHFIYQPDQDSEALAWFKDFQMRSDGIWASEDGLTDIGRGAVKNKHYKYTSFVADRKDLQKIDGGSGAGLPRYRVMGIETVGFTNMANGRELLTPITNRQGEELANESGLPRQRIEKDEAAQDTLTASINSADPLTPDERGRRDKAYEMWWEKMLSAREVAKKKGGTQMPFQWLWDRCKAEYPHIYEAAFGNPSSDAAASSEAEANAALQQVSAIANRTAVEEGNMAGVQKRAEKLFTELVQGEQRQCGISFSHAFTRVKNREKTLCDLANYTIAPREAFEREPSLRGKLLNTASRSSAPVNDGEVYMKAMQLFNKCVEEEMAGGASRMIATIHTKNKNPILARLADKQMKPHAAFRLEPELRAKLI